MALITHNSATLKVTGDNVSASILIGDGSLSVSGFSPTLDNSSEVIITAGYGSLLFSGYDPTLDNSSEGVLIPGVGTIQISGQSGSTNTDNTLSVTTESLEVSGQSISFRGNGSSNPATGSLEIGGFSPQVLTTSLTEIIIGSGTLQLTGYSPSVYTTESAVVIPGTTSLNFTGYRAFVVLIDTITPPERVANVSMQQNSIQVGSFSRIAILSSIPEGRKMKLPFEGESNTGVY